MKGDGKIPDDADDVSRGSGQAAPREDVERRRFFEIAVPEIVKRVVERAIESGTEKLSELSDKPETLRNFVADLRLPKDVMADLYGQIDDTKNGLYRVVAKEIRDVLEQTKFSDELVRALTKLSFEIRTEIRFVPNSLDKGGDTGPDDRSSATSVGGVKPKITSDVTLKDRGNGDRKR